jgi:hypothetical protein
MSDHPAKALKDQLADDMSKAKASKPSKQKQDRLKRDIGKYYDELEKEADERWKGILMDERKRAQEAFDTDEHAIEGDPEDKRKEKLDEGMRTLDNSLGWIVPVPPDPAKVAEVIARDRAAAEKAGHPVGPIKKVNQWA